MSGIDSKVCTSCKDLKTLESFHRRASAKDGRKSQCKQCAHDKYKVRYANDLDYRERVLDRTRRRDVKKQFNISLEEYERHMKDKSCAICDKEDNLVLDHCHNSGKIRGVLCHNCNVGIGHLKDSSELVSRALYYLQDEG